MSADSSPPRKIAAMTPPRIVAAPSNLFNNGTPSDIFISPHFKKWDPIADDRQEKKPVDNVDYTHMIPGGLNGLLKRQGEQNKRDMQDILGHTKRKAKKEAKERLLARQSEQRSRQAFKMLQDPVNKQKLRRKKESYYQEGKKLYKVPQRRLMKSDATYDREDLDLAASLRRNAGAAAAACTPDDPWE
jgi:hypothetical protein